MSCAPAWSKATLICIPMILICHLGLFSQVFNLCQGNNLCFCTVSETRKAMSSLKIQWPWYDLNRSSSDEAERDMRVHVCGISDPKLGLGQTIVNDICMSANLSEFRNIWMYASCRLCKRNGWCQGGPDDFDLPIVSTWCLGHECHWHLSCVCVQYYLSHD
jgi:hypothetical protein